MNYSINIEEICEFHRRPLRYSKEKMYEQRRVRRKGPFLDGQGKVLAASEYFQEAQSSGVDVKAQIHTSRGCVWAFCV